MKVVMGLIAAVLDTGPSVKIWVRDEGGEMWIVEVMPEVMKAMVADKQVLTKEHLVGMRCCVSEAGVEI